MITAWNWLKQRKNNVAWYIGGLFTIGLGVNLLKASNLGAGAWDTVTINIRTFLQRNVGWQFVTLGMVSLVISLTLFSIVILYRRQKKYVFMLIPVFLVAFFIDFWNILFFKDYLEETLTFRILLYTSGTFVLPLGLSMIVKSGFPAFVFDELMLLLVKITKAKRIVYVRLVIEFTGIAFGSIFGYFAYYVNDGTLGAVNIGSFIIAFTLAPIMQLYYNILKVPHQSHA
jgi:uncharacterized membrane protein YczE